MPAFSRNINIEIDWVDEDCFEIRGRLDDNVHSVEVTLLVGFPDFVIRVAEGGITRMPYPGYCQGAYEVVRRLVGEKIGRGFRKRAAELVGGSESCSHLHTLVLNMGLSAFQMNYVAAKRLPEAAKMMHDLKDDHPRRREMVLNWMPQLRNSCFVFSESSDELFQLSKAPAADEHGD